MFVTKILRMMSVVAMPVAATLMGTAASAQEFTMKFATLTINDIQHEYMKVYKTELEKATNGRIKVELYPAAQLGGAPRQSEGLRLGTIEAAIGPAELFVGIDPRFQVLAMAGLFKDREHARRVLDNPDARKLIASIGDGRGLATIGYTIYDMQMFNTKTPVNKLGDFANKRIRVLASDGEQAMVRSLGANSVPMSLPEVLPALQQGTIDGVTTVLGVFAALRYYDAAAYLTDTKLWALASLVLVNKPWLDKLPPDLRKAVVDLGAKIEAPNHAWQTDRIAADRATWAKNNGKISSLPADDQAEAVKRVNAALGPVLDKNANIKTFYTGVKAIADRVN